MRHRKFFLSACAATIQIVVGAVCGLPAALASDQICLAECDSQVPNIKLAGKSINRDASVLTPPVTTTLRSKLLFREKDKSPRIVLALGGGGCKVAAQIGVIRSFEKHHIPIDAIVATSMGSLIGALYCSGMPINDIENLFIEKEVQKSLLSKVVINTVLRPIKPLAYLITGRPYAGLSSGEGYLKFLRKNLPARFDQLKIPLAAVVTNITDGQTSVLADGDLPLAILASNAVPTLICPVMINGKLYVDGGLRANLPVEIAQSMSPGLVVSVLVDSAIKPEDNNKFKSKAKLTMRVADIMMASSDRQQAKSTDVLIYPDVDFVPGLTKDADILKRGVIAGERAADLMCPKIHKALIAEEKSEQYLQASHSANLPSDSGASDNGGNANYER